MIFFIIFFYQINKFSNTEKYFSLGISIKFLIYLLLLWHIIIIQQCIRIFDHLRFFSLHLVAKFLNMLTWRSFNLKWYWKLQKVAFLYLIFFATCFIITWDTIMSHEWAAAIIKILTYYYWHPFLRNFIVIKITIIKNSLKLCPLWGDCKSLIINNG